MKQAVLVGLETLSRPEQGPITLGKSNSNHVGRFVRPSLTSLRIEAIELHHRDTSALGQSQPVRRDQLVRGIQ
jgi:hypothetical protein